MKATPKQLEVMRFLATKENATKQEIGNAMTFGYYHNAAKHFGDLLSRMVKQEMISRVSKGVYKLGGNKSVLLDKNQLNLKIE